MRKLRIVSDSSSDILELKNVDVSSPMTVILMWSRWQTSLICTKEDLKPHAPMLLTG